MDVYSAREGRLLLEIADVDAQLVAVYIRNQRAAVGNDLLDQQARNRRFQRALNESLQRTCAVGRIVSVVEDILLRLRRKHDIQPAILQPIGQALDHQMHDRADVLAGQRRVEHGFVQTI